MSDIPARNSNCLSLLRVPEELLRRASSARLVFGQMQRVEDNFNRYWIGSNLLFGEMIATVDFFQLEGAEHCELRTQLRRGSVPANLATIKVYPDGASRICPHACSSVIKALGLELDGSTNALPLISVLMLQSMPYYVFKAVARAVLREWGAQASEILRDLPENHAGEDDGGFWQGTNQPGCCIS